MCHHKHLEKDLGVRNAVLVCLVCSLLVLLQLLLFLLLACLRHPVPMFVWCMFRDSLEFFSGISFWPWGNFPVPNENKQKKYPEFVGGGINVGARIIRRKRKVEVSGIGTVQRYLLLSSSGVMLFKLTFTVNRYCSLKTGTWQTFVSVHNKVIFTETSLS